MEPLTFLVMMRPLSRPSSTRTLTWTASPVIPVRPTTSTTSAGVPSSSGIALTSSARGSCRRGRLPGPGGDAELLLARHVRVRDGLLLAEDGHVHQDFRRVDVFRHHDELGVPPRHALRHPLR